MEFLLGNGSAVAINMMARMPSLLRSSLLVAFHSLLLLSACHAAEKWKSLPPTPNLPEITRTGYLELKDARIWFATYGDESKSVLLMLPGGGASSDYWSNQVKYFKDDYYVIVMDCRGQGRSTDEGSTLSYELMASDVIALLDRLQIKRTAVLGWSDGANIGFYLALNSPDRISSLIAFGGNATPAGYQPNTNRVIFDAYFARTKNEYVRLSPRPEKYAATLSKLSKLWRTQPTLTSKDLGKISVRTAIVHAQHDEIIRRTHSDYLSKQIPAARLIVLKGVGHFAFLQDSTAFNEAVETFLKEK